MGTISNNFRFFFVKSNLKTITKKCVLISSLYFILYMYVSNVFIYFFAFACLCSSTAVKTMGRCYSIYRVNSNSNTARLRKETRSKKV